MKLSHLLNIPNTFTLINLLFGCLGVVFCFDAQLIEYVPYTTAASLVMDFLDGFAARAFKMTTNIGKELDSLADMVSFGFLPGTILYHIAKDGMGMYAEKQTILLTCIPLFVLTLFASLRLAKFNLDDRQSDDFRGLATPACTIFVIGLLAIHIENHFGWDQYVSNIYFLYGMAIFLSVLMLSDIRLFAFKIKGFVLKGNRTKLAFVALSIVMLVTMGSAAWSPIIIIYILLSVLRNYFPNDLFSRN
jgi:CDP-diacylglycerol---serine O-phosphatidyltransferase